ncbi:ankyrin repeat domain-containing protein [Desulfosudis oleivorans]|nr:ankyrin repeat domain-containing protein [Desulfosudis oleivorans]
MRRIFWTLVAVAAIASLTGCGTALSRAAQKGDVAAMEKLLNKGADINESAAGGTIAGPPLSHAAHHCQPEVVRYLVSRGADVEATGFGGAGWRPLHIAVDAGCIKAVEILLDAGADINAKANNRWGSALAIAAMNGDGRLVEYLISRGADVDDAASVLRRWTSSSLFDEDGHGHAEGLALLEKYARPMATAAVSSPQTSVTAVVRSDVDMVPYWKASPRPDAFAVVIGIESYQTIPRSDYSKKDAETIKSYLVALGFQERNVELMTDQRATRSGMAKALEAWLPNQVTNQSTVFVYFSGHGAPEPATGESYLVPYDGDPNYLGVTGYSLKRLYDSLGKLPAKEIIVVLDSCFSGAGGRSVLAKGARPLVMTAAAGPMPARVAVLAAAQGSQISTSAPDKGHGILTYYFLKALKDGKTDLADIYTTIRPQVEDAARRLNVQQSPSLAPGADTIKNRFSLIE